MEITNENEQCVETTQEESAAAETAAVSPKPRDRIWEIDFLRGLSILLMILDHFMWLITYVFYKKWSLSPNFEASWLYHVWSFARDYCRMPFRNFIRPMIIQGFIFTAGVSSGLSRSNIKRGLKLLVISIIVILVFLIAEQIESGSRVLFGILNMYAVSMILFGLVDLGLQKLLIDKDNEDSKDICLYISALIFVSLGLLMMLLGSNFNKANPLSGKGIGALFLWSNDFKKLTADYYPLFPSCGIMFLGAAFGRIVYKNKKSLFGDKMNAKLIKTTKVINAAGKNTIWLYLFHQVIAFLILYLLGLISGLGGFIK